MRKAEEEHSTFIQQHDVIKQLESVWIRLQQCYEGRVHLGMRDVFHELDDLEGCA